MLGYELLSSAAEGTHCQLVRIRESRVPMQRFIVAGETEYRFSWKCLGLKEVESDFDYPSRASGEVAFGHPLARHQSN